MTRFLFILLIVGGMFFLTSCQRCLLVCRTEYLTPAYLASEQINTPDPLRECFWGQQVIVRWNLPRECLVKPVFLRFQARYGTREVEVFEIPLESSFGHYVYQLVNQEYWCKGGIISYQAELCQEGVVLKSWTHHVWTELIEISEDEVVSLSSAKPSLS